MKFKLLFVLLVILLIIGCTQPRSLDSPKAQNGGVLGDTSLEKNENTFLVYEDRIYKVKILYPNTWKLVESKENIFAFQESKLNVEDTVQENLNLMMNDISGQGINFDTFKEAALKNLKQTVPDFSLMESSATTLAGSPAQKMVFTAFSPKRKLIQVITLKNDITYVITFVSEPTSFDNYIGTVQQMLDSFEILGDVKDISENKDSLKNKENKPSGVTLNATALKSAAKDKEVVENQIIKKDLLVGTFRCWSYNVGGAAKSCTSPPLVLHKDGTYSMSNEKGTYFVTQNMIALSESKIRGNGTILEQGNQIRFEYDYSTLHHVVTYLKADGEGGSVETKGDALAVKYVEVSLNIIFPESQGVSGINSVAIVDKESKKVVGEAIAYESKSHTVTALFRKLGAKPGILTGKIYTVQASSGFGYWDVGEIDLRTVTKDVELTVSAKTDTMTKTVITKSETSPKDTTVENTVPEQKVAEPAQTEKGKIPETGPKCDPNIPKYSQPGCVE